MSKNKFYLIVIVIALVFIIELAQNEIGIKSCPVNAKNTSTFEKLSTEAAPEQQSTEHLFIGCNGFFN